MKLTLLLLALFALPAFSATRHVVLISLDGFAAYHLDNPNLVLPNIRSLIKEGVWPEGSETVFPSVTHPSHTTLITGMMPQKHGVLANELPDKDGNLVVGNTYLRSEAIRSKTIFDSAKAKGLVTAAFHWPETVEDKSIDYNLISRTQKEQKNRYLLKNAFTEELVANGIPINYYNEIRGAGGLGLVSDALTTSAACYTILKHKPNLIAIHLANTDHEQHEFGPEHPMAQAALSKADYNVGQIVQAVKEAGLYQDTVFFIAADHGFTSVYDQINLHPYFEEVGIANKIRFYEGGWAPFLRLLSNFDMQTDGPKLDQVFEKLKKNFHVLRIFKSDDYPSLGLPKYEEGGRVRGQYLIVADIETYFVDQPGTSFDRHKRRRPAHGHGFLPYHPKMYPMLVIAGSDIKSGVRIGHVKNVDVAPTISKLLGLEPLDFDGRVLGEALKQ